MCIARSTRPHGQDIADTLGVDRVPSDRLRHVAHLGMHARAFSYTANGRRAPELPVRVALTAPSGVIWNWGPADAADRVSGPALDFCRVVTQRRHRDETALAIRGPAADEWMAIAQAFAGPRTGTKEGAVGMTTPDRTRAVRIANCSGFYGDRIGAAREMVEGGPIDVLTGDYLAELTMLILAKAQQNDPAAGYAKTFLTQIEQVLGSCLDRGIKIVANAGGLNPTGLAGAVRDVAARLRLDVRVAHVEGDDMRGTLSAITPAVTDKPVSANAYLGVGLRGVSARLSVPRSGQECRGAARRRAP